MSGAILAVSSSSQKENRSASDQTRVLYTAEAGISHALSDLSAGRIVPVLGQTGFVGNAANPIAFGGGNYFATVDMDPLMNTRFTVTAVGTSQGVQRAIQAVVEQQAGGIFANALFAGNRDGDPNYTLKFGGKNAQADLINGSIYSGGDVTVRGNATVNGTIRATGTITGAVGEEGSMQPLPDIAAMDYPNNHDVDVTGEFFGGTAYATTDSLGGRAFQLPENNPAHIFRMNPDDRSADINGTPKFDFFLEDPYESVHTDPNSDGSDPTIVTLSGGSNPGPDGNNLTYYIDGNLWVHNKRTYSFQVQQEGTTVPVRVTFIVRGNIYYSDNVFYEDPANDGMAFIAIEDPAEPDSGNIYFGDPEFGTLEVMDSFMYAENNFYDNNLDSAGSSDVLVRGNMTAGNQVLINRDYGRQHSRLQVDFDDRIWTGAITLPGLPGQGAGAGGFQVVSWREIPVP